MSPGISSMTGFASAEGAVAGNRVRFEIKSVNHRFLDLKLRLPRELSAAEQPLRSFLQAAFSRGAIEAKAELVSEGERPVPEHRLNVPMAAWYLERIREMCATLGIPADVSPRDLLDLPEVIQRPGAPAAREQEADAAWRDLETLAARAADGLKAERLREGAALATALGRTVAAIRDQAARLRRLRDERREAYRARVAERVRSVFEAHPLADAGAERVLDARIAQELALILDRTDIEEELTRLENHLGHFGSVLGGGGPAGRKLDFILQELNREANTIGSKAQDYGIAEEVVHLKVAVEQLREQAMNLE